MFLYATIFLCILNEVFTINYKEKITYHYVSDISDNDNELWPELFGDGQFYGSFDKKVCE